MGIQFRRDSTQALAAHQRLDAGRFSRLRPTLARMRHFYRSHLTPADAIAAADSFFTALGLTVTPSGAQDACLPGGRRDAGGPGATALDCARRGWPLHVRRSRDRSDRREPAGSQREALLRGAAPPADPRIASRRGTEDARALLRKRVEPAETPQTPLPDDRASTPHRGRLFHVPSWALERGDDGWCSAKAVGSSALHTAARAPGV